jgi:restriction endonuclease Mrr
MKKPKGPEFRRFFRPILQVLQKLGGAGTAAEIVDQSIELAEVTEAEQEAVNKNGQSRIKNQVHWARQYLAWGGYLDSSKRGVWGLTDKARTTRIDALDPLMLFNTVHKAVVSERQGKYLQAIKKRPRRLSSHQSHTRGCPGRGYSVADESRKCDRFLAISCSC